MLPHPKPVPLVRLAPLADYPARLVTLMAGSDLPQFLKAKCADLTPYLGGDAVKDYPNLAALPTDSWKGAVYDGRLYGVPVVYGQVFRVLWTHQELLDEVGADLPKDTDDFKRVLQLVIRPQAGQYGIGMDNSPATGLGLTTWFEPMMFGAPNNWRADASGKLIKDRETEEYKASVAYTRELVAAGLFHPNAAASNNTQGKLGFAGRKVVFRWDGAASALQFWDQSAALQPPGRLRAAPPFGNGGTKPTYPLGVGQMGFSAIKQAGPERVREVLGILNFLAAPFGTAEHLLVNYGVPGVHHTRDANGNPILTQQGTAEITPSWSFVVRPRPVLFNPKSADFARVLQADQVPYVAAGLADATLGLFSASDAARGAVLEQPFADGVTDIVLGRRPLGDYDQLVKDWQSGGGDRRRVPPARVHEQLRGGRRLDAVVPAVGASPARRRGLAEAGCPYVRIDGPSYTRFVDPEWRAPCFRSMHSPRSPCAGRRRPAGAGWLERWDPNGSA
jgi:putative aldouronate transport system substrate-binding protein